MEGTRAPVPGSWLGEPNSAFVVGQAVVDYLANVGLLPNPKGGRRSSDDRPATYYWPGDIPPAPGPVPNAVMARTLTVYGDDARRRVMVNEREPAETVVT